MSNEPEIKKAEHPYAKKLEEQLTTQRIMLTLLESKLELLSRLTNYLPKPDTCDTQERLQETEWRISKIRTHGEIDVLKKIIAEKEEYFRGYMKQFEIDVVDMEKHYKHTVSIAKRSTKPQVQKILAGVIWERVEGDPEAMIALYKQLKKYV